MYYLVVYKVRAVERLVCGIEFGENGGVEGVRGVWGGTATY